MREVVLESGVARQDSGRTSRYCFQGSWHKVKHEPVSNIQTLYLHNHIKINATKLTKHHLNWKCLDLMGRML